MADTLIHTEDISSQPEFDKPELKQNHHIVTGDIVLCLRKDKFYTIPIGGESDALDKE